MGKQTAKKKLCIDLTHENNEILSRLKSTGDAKSKGSLINDALKATVGLSPEIKESLLRYIAVRKDFALHALNHSLKEEKNPAPEYLLDWMRKKGASEAEIAKAYPSPALYWQEHDMNIAKEYEVLEKLLSL